MKRTVTVLALTLFFTGIRVCLADSPQMGTWKLNEAKSKLAPGSTKNHTVPMKPQVTKLRSPWKGPIPQAKRCGVSGLVSLMEDLIR